MGDLVGDRYTGDLPRLDDRCSHDIMLFPLIVLALIR
jgi:hypothetical protein